MGDTDDGQHWRLRAAMTMGSTSDVGTLTMTYTDDVGSTDDGQH